MYPFSSNLKFFDVFAASLRHFIWPRRHSRLHIPRKLLLQFPTPPKKSCARVSRPCSSDQATSSQLACSDSAGATMPKIPREVDGFAALPLQLPETKAFPQWVTHYLYVKPHEPQIPDADAPRSLFLVNVPVSATSQRLKRLFSAHLEGGRVEKVSFLNDAKHVASAQQGEKRTGRKRKRVTAEEIEAGLDKIMLPKAFDVELNETGATAIVVFVDRPSMQLSWKAVRRAAKQGVPVSIYGAGDSTVLGIKRYTNHHRLAFPSRDALLRSVNAYMTAYSALEDSRARDNARKRAEPDEDGFITVTRGSKGAARMDEAKEVAERMKEKDAAKGEGMGDFYRFQTRERRKKEMEGFVQRFEEDKAKVEEMRRKRRAAQS
jgi:hypothetical protein